MKHSVAPLITCLILALPGAALAKDKIVRVFILAGQSNMEGHGRIAGEQKGTLETLSRDPATASRYRHLQRNGKWITRNDVWITWLSQKGKLGVGGWAAKGAIGPELGFGWVVGDFLEDPSSCSSSDRAGPAWQDPGARRAPGRTVVASPGERESAPSSITSSQASRNA